MVETDLVDALWKHMEDASHKNLSIRLEALRQLYLLLRSNYLQKDLIKYKTTLFDLAMHAINQGDEACMLGARLLAVLAVQLGPQISALLPDALRLLRSIVKDAERCPAVRAAVAHSIGITAHFACENEDVNAICFKTLVDTWTSLEDTACDPLETCLLASTIGAWCLLIAKADNEQLDKAVELQPTLVTLLSSNQLEVRLAAAEALALLYEITREKRQLYQFPNHEQLVKILEVLAAAERSKEQYLHMTFKQLHAFITEEEAPLHTVALNKEQLELNTCLEKIVYDQLTSLLREANLREQLKRNTLLREFFDLETPVEEIDEKLNKTEKKSIDKTRDQQRKTKRDKRNF